MVRCEAARFNEEGNLKFSTQAHYREVNFAVYHSTHVQEWSSQVSSRSEEPKIVLGELDPLAPTEARLN